MASPQSLCEDPNSKPCLVPRVSAQQDLCLNGGQDQGPWCSVLHRCTSRTRGP